MTTAKTKTATTLTELYTVMLHDTPHVVEAKSLEEALQLAVKGCSHLDNPEAPTKITEREGDAS